MCESFSSGAKLPRCFLIAKFYIIFLYGAHTKFQDVGSSGSLTVSTSNWSSPMASIAAICLDHVIVDFYKAITLSN